MHEPVEIVLYAVGAVALIVAVIAAVAFVLAVVTDRRRRQAGVRPAGIGVTLSDTPEMRGRKYAGTRRMGHKRQWRPSRRWDLIGTADGMNAVLRLEFATGEKERQAVQLIIATPTFRELAETFIRFAGKPKGSSN